MKVLKTIIPVTILLSVLVIDYYNKFYKENTDFDEETIFLYVIEGDSLSFADSISKYLNLQKHFIKLQKGLTI